MPRNKGISTIQVIKCRTVEIPFLLSWKQINLLVWQGLRISLHFASAVMQESTPRAVTDGTMHDPRGGRNLYALRSQGTARGSHTQKLLFKGPIRKGHVRR